MKITPTRNLTINGNTLICAKKDGVVVSSLDIDFGDKIELKDFDHCDCITSDIVAVGNTLKIKLVTEKRIDEFIILMLRIAGANKTLKFRFIR